MKNSYKEINILSKLNKDLDDILHCMKNAINILSNDTLLDYILIDINSLSIISIYSIHDYLDFKSKLNSEYIVLSDSIIKKEVLKVITKGKEYTFTCNNSTNIKFKLPNILINQQLN